MRERLLGQVKRKLNITWNDSDTDNRLTDIIESAVPTLAHKLGIADNAFDFSTPSIENTLFLAYCLYEYNHCANEFDDNYANTIAQARAKHDVAYYEALGEATDEE